jgi:thiosulfate reductase cytochrome b subunit
LVKKIVHWSLTLATIVYLITGLGITQYRVVELLTFGLLSRNLAFIIHDSLLVPFVILLIAHIALSILSRNRKPLRDSGA